MTASSTMDLTKAGESRNRSGTRPVCMRTADGPMTSHPSLSAVATIAAPGPLTRCQGEVAPCRILRP
eukprot:6936001-Alexandrium_andersonii.AAC.1